MNRLLSGIWILMAIRSLVWVIDMRVLIACECSGRVRDAFIKKGHDAWSCDILPTELPGNHYQCDVAEVIGDNWDMIIAFPDCTYLCSSGIHWNKRVPGRQQLTEKAYEFFMFIANQDCPKIAIENPVGIVSTRWRKPDQIIQPYQFGEDASKQTCLWLKNLPLLKPTKFVEPRYVADWYKCDLCDDFLCRKHGKHVYDCSCKPIDKWTRDPYVGLPRWGNQTDSGQNRLGPSEDRSSNRSRTYQGIADAMADQWGG